MQSFVYKSGHAVSSQERECRNAKSRYAWAIRLANKTYTMLYHDVILSIKVSHAFIN